MVLIALAEGGERLAPHRFDDAVARDRAEQVGVFDSRQRANRDGFAGGALGNLAEDARIGDRFHRLEALGFAGVFERLERQIPEHGGGLGADAVVAIVAGNRGELGGHHQLGDGGFPHTRILVFTRDRGNGRAIVQRQLVDEREPHRGVRIFFS